MMWPANYPPHILLHILLSSMLINVQAADLFWRDDKAESYVIDTQLHKELPVFRKQFQTYPLQFNGNTPAYSTNFSTLSGFSTRYVPRRYKTKFLLELNKHVHELYPSEQNRSISSMADAIIERSDFNPIITKCSNDISEVTAIVVLNEKWGKNDYGDIAIYTDDNEIKTSIHPKSGRVVFMKCGTKFKLNPPSIAKEQRLRVRIIEYATQRVKISSDYEQTELGDFLGKSVTETTAENENEIDVNENRNEINVADYVTKRITTPDGKQIYIFDELFPRKFVREIYSFVREHAEYYEEEIETNSEDNVRWIIDLDFPRFTDSPIWAILKKAISYISGRTTYHPYDITCNHIRRTDITTIHTDCNPELDGLEYTNLLYLNPGWDADLHGETIFLNGNEFVAAVRPKFGRLVIFDGRIEHSARPPSLDVNGARFSFAVKTAKDIEAANRRKKD